MTSVRAPSALGEAEEIHAVAVRHEEVGEDDGVRLGRVGQGVARRLEPRRQHHVEPLAPEEDRQHLAQPRLVVDDEHLPALLTLGHTPQGTSLDPVQG